MSLPALLYDQLGTTQEILVKQVLKDVQEVFTTMVGVEDLLSLPLQVDPKTHFSNCITAMVGFAGLYNGLLSLHVPQKLALVFTSSMLGMKVSEINDDVSDALGEIANMIAGSFKHHLSKDGHEVRLSTPSVVSGKEYMISSGALANTLTLLFDSNDEWFMISVVVEMD
ncbi:MAG: chemotaxis protein CheX [Geobacteraceae bacterium]|nr:chemotaxis protein CheX [Geobacteraceae bacterium]